MSGTLFAEIITVGDELLGGRTVNTNAAFLARELQKLGFLVKHQQTVADDAREITAALAAAAARSHVVVFSGGLGPTDDDLTKETVAKALGMPLVQDDSVLAEIEAFFESRGREMAENNRKQALVPQGAEVLHNENGTAPGICIRSGKQAIVLLPGPPYELQPLFTKCAAPLLAQLTQGAVSTATLGVCGIGESELETRIKALLYGDNPHAALYAKEGEVEITVTASGADAAAADALVAGKVEQLRAALGDCVFTDEGDSLAEAVVKQLAAGKLTVATAESCTGGMLAEKITAVPGSSSVFEYGLTSYADWVKSASLDVDKMLVAQHSAISSVVAAEMARGARRNGKASFGIGITGVAGPGRGAYLDKPVGLVYIAVCDKKNTAVKEFRFGDRRGRDSVRHLAVRNALDMLRRFAAGLPIADAEEFTEKQIADLAREGRPRTKAGLAAKKSFIALLAAGLTLTGSYFGIRSARAIDSCSVYEALDAQYSAQAVTADYGAALDALLAENADAAGWLFSADGGIDTVVVRERTGDYYRSHDFTREPNYLGCAAVLADTELAQAPDNLVVTAASEGQGVLFCELPRYLDDAFAQRNNLLTFNGADFSAQYRLFSVFLLDSGEGVDEAIYRSSFADAEQLQQFIINAKLRSIYNIELDIRTGDRFLTLVTELPSEWEGCRLVVVARQLREDEGVGSSIMRTNGAALYPAQWYARKGIVCGINVTGEKDKWLEWFLENDQGTAAGNALTVSGAEATKIAAVLNGSLVEDTPLAVVSRIVAARIDEDFRDETVKAVAVAAASELKYAYAHGEARPAFEASTPTEAVKALVAQVIDQALTYDGAVCWTPAFRCSGGVTNDAGEALGGEWPYLVPVTSAYDYIVWSNGYHRTSDFSASVLQSRLESYFGITLSGDRAGWITVLSTTSSGYALEVSVDGQRTVSGEEFFVGVLSMPSAKATVSVYGSTFSVTSLGTGDGIGMSIIGANEYVRQAGWGYERILTHYFTGAVLTEDGWDAYYTA